MAPDIRTRASVIAHELLIKARPPKGQPPDIVVKDDSGRTVVDEYWNDHILHSRRFVTPKESERYLRQRNAEYPKFTELMDLYGDHTGQVILDYGCGPGDDVTGFLLWSNAKRVIGMDVSGKALSHLRHRLALHEVDHSRVELIRITDAMGRIPLPDDSIDWIQCGGVLHHTTHPQEIVHEFHRVMKPGAEGRLMLYNRDSLRYHLCVAYVDMIVENLFAGLTVDQAFTKTTDGPACPVSDPWPPQRVLDMLEAAGFEASFRGGYPYPLELEAWTKHGRAAIHDNRLGEEHRRFLAAVTLDQDGLPTWNGKYAGNGGVYTIRKPI